MALVTRPNLGLTSNFAEAQKGWGSAMNANLDAIDAAAPTNAAAYATFQEAIDATPAGGRLYAPSANGPYVAPTSAGWTIDKSIEIFSDGPNIGEDVGFQYANSSGAANKDDVVFNLTKNATWFYLHDTVISNGQGAVSTDGTGDAIRFSEVSGALAFATIARTRILYSGRNGIRFVGNAYGVHLTIKDTQIQGHRGSGLFASLVNILDLNRVVSSVNNGTETPSDVLGSCFTIIGCAELLMQDCTAEVAGEGLTNAQYEAYIYLENCKGGHISSCHVEDQGQAAIQNGITINSSQGIQVGGCTISFPNTAAGSKGINILGASKGNVILSNTFNFVDDAVYIDSAADDYGNLVLPQAVPQSNATTPGKVTVPAAGRNFVFFNNLASGVADTKGVGLLLPSMPDVANIDSSVIQDGLLVYDSTAKAFRFRANTAWGGVYVGSGTPEASVAAPPGSLYVSTAGGASTTLYVKESGTGNTGWIAK